MTTQFKENILHFTSRGIDFDPNILIGKIVNTKTFEVETSNEDACSCTFADVDIIENTFEGDVVIADVKVDNSGVSDDDVDYEGISKLIVTFYGTSKQIYQANVNDGSSGWDYGTLATLKVKVTE